MADEVNIRFGATIDDLKDKLGLIGELFKGIGQGARSELGDRAGGAFKDLGNSGQAAATSLNSQFSQISSSFRSLLTTLGVTVSVGAFVSMIKGSIDAADHLNDLSQKTGVAVETLGGIGFAATQAGGTLDSAASAIGKLSKTVAAAAAGNEEAAEPFKAMGIEVTDAAGKTKAADVILGEVAARFETYADGPEKTALAMRIFGKSGADLIPMLNEGKKALEENTEYYKKYGGVTNETAKQADQFNDTAGKISLIMGGFARTLAAALLPMLQALADAFLDSREKGGLLAGAVDLIKTAFEAIVVFGANVIYTLGVIGRSLAAVAAGMMALKDFNLEGVHQIRVQLDLDNEKAKRDLTAFEQRVMGTGASDYGNEGRRGKKPADKAKLDAPRMRGSADAASKEAEKIAASKRALQKAENEADLSLQKEYFKEAGAYLEETNKQNLLSISEYYDAKLALERRGIQASIAAKEKDRDEAKGAADNASGAEKNKYLAQAVKLQGEINVLTAQEANAVRTNTAARESAERQLAVALNAIKAARDKAAAEDDIQTDRATMEQKKALRLIDAQQAFELEREFEQRSYRATLAAIEAKRAAIKGDVGPEAEKSTATLYAEEEGARRTHQQKMLQIDHAANVERKRDSLSVQSSIQGSFSGMIAGLLNGTAKIGDAFRSFATSVASTFTNLIAQKFTDKLFDATGAKKAIDKMVNFFVDGIGDMVGKFMWGETTKNAFTVQSEVVKTNAVVAGAGARSVAEQGAAASSTATTASTAIMNIGAKAWEAAAAVYASIAAIPYVGPFLAPAMAIAAGAAVIGYISNISSSEGGEYNVGEDRINLVHKNETILPAHFAQGLRDLVGQGGLSPVQKMAETMDNAWRAPANPLSRIQSPTPAPTAGSTVGGGGRGGGGGTFNIGFVDTRGAEQFIKANARHLATAIEGQARNFSFKGKT